MEGREDARDLTRRVRFVPAFDGLAPYELFLLDVGNQVAFLRRWRLNELKSWSRRVPCDVRGDASSQAASGIRPVEGEMHATGGSDTTAHHSRS